MYIFFFVEANSDEGGNLIPWFLDLSKISWVVLSIDAVYRPCPFLRFEGRFDGPYPTAFSYDIPYAPLHNGNEWRVTWVSLTISQNTFMNDLEGRRKCVRFYRIQDRIPQMRLSYLCNFCAKGWICLLKVVQEYLDQNY